MENIKFDRKGKKILFYMKYRLNHIFIQLIIQHLSLTHFISTILPTHFILNFFAGNFSLIATLPLLNRFIDHNDKIKESLGFLIRIHTSATKNSRKDNRVTKSSCDELLNNLNCQGQNGILFFIDKVGQNYGYHNLEPIIRYLFTRLIQYSSKETISELKSFEKETIDLLQHEFSEGIKPNYSTIAKHLLLPVVESDKYHRISKEPIYGMPKILLIGSYFGYEMRGGLFVAPQLGIHRIASFLSFFGIQADICDPRLSSIDEIKDIVSVNKYQIIGFNILYPPFDSLKLVHEIHQISPWSLLLAGGQGAAFDYRLILENSPVSAVISAYGEFPLLDLIVDNFKIEHIKGLYYKADDGSIAYTGTISAFTQNDLRVVSLALDFSKIPYDIYWKKVSEVYSSKHLKLMKAQESVRTIRLYTETHCPMKCDFCSSTNFLDNAIQGIQKVRFLNASDILLLIRRALKIHPSTQAFYFNDDEFLLNKKRIKDLCLVLKIQSIYKGLKFICMARVDNINEEILTELKAAGFSIISYGIESFSNRVLMDMDKKLNSVHSKNMGQIAIDAVELTLEAGLTPRINFILFYPTITKEDLQITIDCATNLILKGAPPTYYTFVELFPGASIMNKDYKSGWVFEKQELPDGSVIEIPTKVLPLDEKIRKICLKALEIHVESVQKLKKSCSWSLDGNLPTSIDTLVLFNNLCELLSIPSEKIKKAINQLIIQILEEEKDNNIVNKDFNEPILAI